MNFNVKSLLCLFVFWLLLQTTMQFESRAWAQAQDDPFAPGSPAVVHDRKQVQQAEKEENDAEPEQVEIDTSQISSRRPQFPQKYIRFHMWDGSILGGEIESDSIDIETDFGPLVVPVSRLVKLFPGLQSLPDLNSKIEALVAGLGDKDFDVREKSQQELIAMGVQIRSALDGFENGGSAERKKRLGEVRTALDALIEDFEDVEQESGQPLVVGDTVVTPDFSIVGKIKNDSFRVKNKFGLLTIQLADIRIANRGMEQEPDAIRKTVTVPGTAFFQTKSVSSGIRVNPGDRIEINATGIVNWTNRNKTSSPNGIPNYGSYKGIHCGTLCARIGKEGAIQKVGNDSEFVVQQVGILYLAIAMQDSYASGYRFSGSYKANIRVIPSEN